MAIGPGKYDTLCSYVREQAQAEAALVIIVNGNHASGFSCQTTSLGALAALAETLQRIAHELSEEIKADLQQLQPKH